MTDQPPDDADQVRDIFRRLVPDAPETPGRAAAVRRRGLQQRRRTIGAGALVVAAAAAAVIVVPSMVGDSPVANDLDGDPTGQVSTSPAEPSTTPGGAPALDPFAANLCPERLTLQAGGDLPHEFPTVDDVVSVRLCQPEGDPYQSNLWDPPADALVTDLDGFVDAVRALPTADPHRCDAIEPAPDPEALVLTSADGSTAIVGAVSGSCGDIEVGDKTVAASDVFAEFDESLAAQRRILSAPSLEPPPLDCGTPPTRVQPDPQLLEVTGMLVCPRLREGTPYEVTGDDLAVFGEAWSDAVRRSDPDYEDVNLCPETVNNDLILVTTNFADVVRLEFDGCGNYQFPAGALGGYRVTLTDAELGILGLPTG